MEVEGSPGLWAKGVLDWHQLAPVAQTGAGDTVRGHHSLAFCLCISLGSCIEATQLCPVIGRNCKRQKRHGCVQWEVGAQETPDQGLVLTGAEVLPRLMPLLKEVTFS